LGGYNLFSSSFRKKRPEGKWSLAHPLREPLRFIGQSMIVWPAAALASIMIAAPKPDVEPLSPILKLALQTTIVYPIIVIAAFALYFVLTRLGQAKLAPLPLIVPMAIVAVWLVTLTLFLLKYAISAMGLG